MKIYLVCLDLGLNTYPVEELIFDAEDAYDRVESLNNHLKNNKKYFKKRYDNPGVRIRTFKLVEEERL